MENAAVEKEYIGDEELELGLGLSLGMLVVRKVVHMVEVEGY